MQYAETGGRSEKVQKLGEISDQIEKCDEEISDCELTLVKIEKSETYLKQPYGAIVFLLHSAALFFVYLIVEKYAWYVIAIALFIVFSIIHGFVNSIATSNINKRLKKQRELRKNLERKLDSLVEEYLLPEIYNLGMVTAQNVIDRTSARRMSLKIVRVLMEQEARRGNFERISLKSDILYKGRHKDAVDNIERVVLDIS